MNSAVDFCSLVQLAPDYYSDQKMFLEEKYRDLGVPDSEMELLRKQIESGTPWRDVIHAFTTHKKSSWLERIILSPSRSMFFDLINFDKVKTVLDLGAGYGQLTLPLSRLVEQVLSVEPTRERMDIVYAICKQEGISNVSFILSDFFNLDIQSNSIDLAILCGVYEWLGKGRTEDVRSIQTSALVKLEQLLSSNGQLVIAIENRVGMKYLLGEKDDHTGSANICYLPFEEANAKFLDQYKTPLRPRTYDMQEYKETLLEVGFKSVKFYLAFPDYKLPHLIIPAEDPKLIDEIIKYIGTPAEHDGNEGDISKYAPMLEQIYRSLTGLDVVKYFAPSFVIVAEKK